MLVKITDFPDELVSDLKLSTGQNTASKAVYFAASNYAQLATENTQLGFDCVELQLEIERLKAIIESARSASAALLECVSQADLFEGERT